MDRIAPTAVSMLLFAALSTPFSGRAEPFVDLRVGYAATEDGDLTVDASVFGSATAEVEFDDSVTGGLRLGYWLDFAPWLGVAAEASYFAPDLEPDGPEVDVIPVTPLLLARVPIASDDDYPHGRVQPFAGVGPGIFVSQFDANGYSDGEVTLGLDVHAGLKVHLTPVVALFAQYRYTWFEPEYTDESPVFPVDVDTELELRTHHAAAGIAFHF